MKRKIKMYLQMSVPGYLAIVVVVLRQIFPKLFYVYCHLY